jgi:hypothetical protein
MPIVIKVDDLRHTMDVSFEPAGAVFGVPYDGENTVWLLDRLNDFGVSRVILETREGLNHPLAAALKGAGLMVAAGTMRAV